MATSSTKNKLCASCVSSRCPLTSIAKGINVEDMKQFVHLEENQITGLLVTRSSCDREKNPEEFEDLISTFEDAKK